MSAPFPAPRLLADIGGTYARFALETAPGVFAHLARLRCADHADVHAAISAYLAQMPDLRVTQAALAIANPVEGDEVRMTNYHWRFSIEQMRERLGLQTLVVVNDFTALAMALPGLAPEQRRQVGGGHARPRSVIGVVGAGSGLGVSGLIPAGDGWIALGTEGGHTSFAPRDERELLVLRHAARRFEHVSFERVVSGPGLELVHAALAAEAGGGDPLPAPEITRRALAGNDPVCAEAVETFCRMLGTAASDLAVTLGALGGVYVGGGIVPQLGALFDASGFRARFEDKGRFSSYLRGIPTWVVTAEQATFLGVSSILASQLRSTAAEQRDTSILALIRRALPGLTPAERRVGEHVLAHPRAALSEPIAEIARAAEVSQPTVIRFCRSLGCEGLSDFKLRLASGLTGTVPVTHTQVTVDDSMIELGEKVLGNTAGAILQVRDHLNREAIDRAIELLGAARRIEFHAVGHYRVVADDAQFKFLRFGVPTSSYTDPRLQVLAARVLGEGDVVVVISSSGRVPELLEVADLAHGRGARVVAITASQSPLARKADVALAVDHDEDVETQVPMIGRILHLLVIDILAVGVAVRQGRADPELLEAASRGGARAGKGSALPAAQVPAPGVRTATPLAHLTTHSR